MFNFLPTDGKNTVPICFFPSVCVLFSYEHDQFSKLVDAKHILLNDLYILLKNDLLLKIQIKVCCLSTESTVLIFDYVKQ